MIMLRRMGGAAIRARGRRFSFAVAIAALLAMTVQADARPRAREQGIAIGVLPVSFAVLLAAGGSFPLLVAFTLLMGASQGVITIVRGAVPLALFGPNGYGAVLGVIATPVLIVNAVSPTVFAMLVDQWGWRVAQIALVTVSTASFLAIEVMSRWYERSRRS